MAKKETKRKAFNFFRSYYDVYNELSDKDKVAFMDALLDRQFLGSKPNNLSGMANFAYLSQENSIDSQVKGYEDKTGTKLSENVDSKEIEGGTVGGTVGPSVQEKEKGKEKGKEEVYSFDEFWNDYDKKQGTAECKKKYSKLTPADKAKMKLHVVAYVASTPDKQYRKNPSTYLNQKLWLDELPTSTQGTGRINYNDYL